VTTGKLILLGLDWYCRRIRVEPGKPGTATRAQTAGSGTKSLHSSRCDLYADASVSGVVKASAWDLAVECIERALDEGVAPSLVRLGRLGQLGSLPSFVAALGDDDDPSSLAQDFARERESLGLSPSEVAGELLVLGRVLDAHDEVDARHALDRCIAAYVARVTGELAERARRDPLTGLLNHEAFHGRLAAEAARARRYRGRLALLLFDLDRFKEANDRHGHQEGDRLLRVFAAALDGTARETDFLGRLGGDEFGALLLEADAATANAFLARLHARLPDGPEASAGVAFLPDEATTPEQLLGLADRRLYAEKPARAA
jgi:diguanylate cyclase (GGDEF)-like protein